MTSLRGSIEEFWTFVGEMDVWNHQDEYAALSGNNREEAIEQMWQLQNSFGKIPQKKGLKKKAQGFR
jgi:hypothetical protein